MAQRLSAAPVGSADHTYGILRFMTRTLDAAIAKLTALPPEEQERVGRWILEQLRDDEAWSVRFDASGEVLGRLAVEARADRVAGRANGIDPERL